MIISRAEKQRVRLNNYTTELVALENEKRNYYRKQWLEQDLSSNTIQTLYYMQDRIDYLVFSIVKKVDWFINNDEDFENEIANQVYDLYASQLHRGITCLMHHFQDR